MSQVLLKPLHTSMSQPLRKAMETEEEDVLPDVAQIGDYLEKTRLCRVTTYTHSRQQNADFCSTAGQEETVECFQNTGSMRRLGSLYFYQGPLQKEGSADSSSSGLWQLLMLKRRNLKWHTENGAGGRGYECSFPTLAPKTARSLGL